MRTRTRMACVATLAGCVGGLGLLSSAAVAQHSGAMANAPAIDHYHINRSKLAIDGYDPVAYFAEGGGQASKGQRSLTHTHQGVTYRFANQANLDRFRADPDKYRPAYGGWCAWAMTTGDKTEINPKTFKIASDGRLLLFYNGFFGNTLKDWGDQDAELLPKADGQWSTITGEPPHFGKERSMTRTDGPLNKKLDGFREQWASGADEQTKAVFERGIEQVGASGVLTTALKPGAKAPVFTLPNARGEDVSIASLLADGPIVVTFYRGGWCPYCNLQLKAYQDRLDEFEARNATLVAISPETPDNSLSTKEKNELAFHVLSDRGNKVAHAFGAAYVLPPELRERFGDRLAGINGDDSATLPLAATFVVDRQGVVRWSFIEDDYRIRAEPDDLIEALDAL